MSRRGWRRAWAAVAVVLALTPAGVAAGDAFEDRLRSRIEALIRGRTGSPAPRVEIPALSDFRPPADAAAPVELDVSTRPGRITRGSIPVTVVLRSAGRELKRGIVTVRVTRTRTVAVATRALRARSRIGPSDVRLAAIDERRVPRDAVLEPEELVGRQTTRSVAAGAPLRRGGVQDAPAVSRGELVRLRLQRGALRIDAVGRARDDGAPGDRVRVVNLGSQREVLGTVTADGVVHVAF